MPSAARQSDICTGHGCWPPRPNTSWSTDVYVNGLGWHRKGDGWATHCCPPPCHTSVLAEGSCSVYVNGKSAGRIGDPVKCGSAVARGSGDVYAGG